MASVTITDLLMLVAVLFILYFIINTITKKTKEDFADVNLDSSRTVKIDKSCSQASINHNYLDYIFKGKNTNPNYSTYHHPYECQSSCILKTVDGTKIGKINGGFTKL